jgi:V8-like Glu-specific endopeptidase
MVLTAAHCVRRGGSRNVWLNNLNDGSKADRGVRGIYAEVVAYSGRGYRSYETKDLALLELHPNNEQLEQIKKRGFARISPRKDFVRVNDKVTMIGCPSRTFYSRSCNVLRIDQTTGTDSLRTDLEPYKGQSGGGLFKGRHLVGVVQSGRGGRARGGFGNLESIYELLDDSGYSYLYTIFFVFIFK